MKQKSKRNKVLRYTIIGFIVGLLLLLFSTDAYANIPTVVMQTPSDWYDSNSTYNNYNTVNNYDVNATAFDIGCADGEYQKWNDSSSLWECGGVVLGDDTNASTECAGTTTYLDGEGNCDDISSVYFDSIADFTDTLVNDKFCTYDGTDIDCNTTVSVGSGDITAVNTGGAYLLGGAVSGDVSLLLNETKLNATISLLDTDTNTQLSEEQVEDFVGGMLIGTQTGITISYQDATGDIDFIVDFSSVDECSDITNCVPSAFDNINDFTGTLTSGKWCVYDGAEIDCNVEPVTDSDTTYTAGNTYIYLSGTQFLFNETKLNATIDARMVDDSDTVWNITGSNYLINSSGVLELNESLLNTTIDARDTDTTYSADNFWLYLTGTTFYWNETRANNTYLDDTDTHVEGDGVYLYNDSTTMTFNDTLLNTTIDARSINVTLTEEEVEDYCGGMVTGNTETGMSVTYEDGDGTFDFVLDSIDVTDLTWSNDWMIAYSNGDGLVELAFGDADGDFLMSNGEGALTWETPTDTDTTYDSDEVYIYEVADVFNFNDTLLNATIDARSTNDTNTDTQDISYNDTTHIITLVDGGEINISGLDNNTLYTATGNMTLTGTMFDVNMTSIKTYFDTIYSAIGALFNIVEDTTPQLGGNLDSNGNNITLGDNEYLVFGDDSDFKIYYNGSNGIIEW